MELPSLIRRGWGGCCHELAGRRLATVKGIAHGLNKTSDSQQDQGTQGRERTEGMKPEQVRSRSGVGHQRKQTKAEQQKGQPGHYAVLWLNIRALIRNRWHSRA
jgi:hypothetical protein